MEEAKVGVIPPSLDQVVIGDMERTRLNHLKVLFLSGQMMFFFREILDRAVCYRTETENSLQNKNSHYHREQKEKHTRRNFICI